MKTSIEINERMFEELRGWLSRHESMVKNNTVSDSDRELIEAVYFYFKEKQNELIRKGFITYN